MKYIVLILSIMTISGAGIYASEESVKDFARKLREKEIHRWDQERFYGQLKKIKKQPKKRGLHKIFQVMKKINNR